MFPLSIVIYDPGLGGVPTTTNPRNLAGWVEEYSDSICLGFGCETMRITGRAKSREEAADWVGRLMSSVEVYTPTGRLRFSGFLNELVLPTFDAAVSLTNMANAIITRWGDPDGKQGTTTVTNAASIAKYGRKERVLNESISLEADATNRATMILAQIAEPLNKETVVPEKDNEKGFPVTLVFVGWAEALKWLTTSSTTETTQASTTQVANLITAYNAVNNFFDTTASSITATGHAATQFCPPDTTYLERIDKLLSFADTSQRRIAWGFYSRAITIAVAATANPDTITYNYSKRAGELRDAYGNVIEPYDWVPDVMVQNVDVIGPAPASGAIASLTRKYIRRATLRIDKSGIPRGTLEPDDVESLPDLVANPVSKNTGISQRHQIAEARIRDAMGSRTLRTDNAGLWNSTIGALRSAAGGTGASNTGILTVPSNGTIDLGGGGLTTGGGSINTGGGSVTNTGGGAVDLGTGGGIGGAGSSGVTTAGGTSPRLAEFSGSNTLASSTLIASGAGVKTIASSTTGTLTLSSYGTLALGGFTLTLDGSLRATGAGAISGQALIYDGAKFTPTTLASTDLSNFNEAVDDRVAALIVDSSSVAWTYTDASNTLSAALVNEAIDDRVNALLVAGSNVTLTYNDTSNTLTVAATGSVDGSGAATRVPIWLDADTLTSDGSFVFSGGVLYVSNLFVAGVSSEITIQERDGAPDWSLYANAGTFRFWDGAADVVTIDTNGKIVSASDTIDLGGFTLNLDGALRVSGAGAVTGNFLRHNGTAFVAADIVAGDLPAHASTHNNGGADEVALDTSQITTGTMATARLGSGTASSTRYLRGDSTWQLLTDITSGLPTGTGTTGRLAQWDSATDLGPSTVVKSGAGVLTLSAASAYTLTVPATGTALLGTGFADRVPYFSGTNTVTSNADLVFDGTTLQASNFNVTGSAGGYHMDERDGAGRWTIYSNNSSFRIYEATSSVNRYYFSSSAFWPEDVGLVNLGTASNYWQEINYKNPVDRGCLGWFDEGVELQDGRKVSDVEALLAIQRHPALETTYGVPRLDYTTMPKAVYKPAPIATEDVYDDGTLRWKAGEKMGEDGADAAALSSIMLGAIKELAADVAALKAALPPLG